MKDKTEIVTVVAQSVIDFHNRVILHNGEVFKYYEQGLTREVYINDDKSLVLKVNQKESDYMNYNKAELEIYENRTHDNFAKTWMEGEYIIQEYCEDLNSKPMTLGQMLFASSCRDEVGWNREGKLVCFDLDEYKKY